MLINVKDRLDQRPIYELLELSVFPDPDRIVKAINEYKENARLHIQGYEDNGEIIGIIGYESDDDRIATIRHIAVHPDERGKGYGRGMVLHLIDAAEPERIEAETDEEGVNFYRSIGFTVHSLGEKYPGTERFRCVYVVSPEEEEED
ncbi:GNAT family N-acetyltransferase [Cohnella hashimotonis]|uniref:GNAT family N-acetyltransferase n=1 Tax=Cohnella hashimotonis TaxID=2826895 RepID=A0ABT6TGZ1_9BACL|nr:GNAT family N-acetyltransferase [Cohnella hashimotonis]MDI4646108.1 GNAT family N-acetyltransferase [Cohnella hashimotonis]